MTEWIPVSGDGEEWRPIIDDGSEWGAVTIDSSGRLIFYANSYISTSYAGTSTFVKANPSESIFAKTFTESSVLAS